jgi:hypothetical protein
MLAMVRGYLFEGLELLIRKVAYTKYDATGLVPWSNFNSSFFFPLPSLVKSSVHMRSSFIPSSFVSVEEKMYSVQQKLDYILWLAEFKLYTCV